LNSLTDLGSFWFGIGECGSANWWKRSHNRHHADPQRHGADVDMNTLPLAFDSITARNGNSHYLKFQHWLYQSSVWALVQLWQFYTHPKSMLKHKSVMDMSFFTFHWILYLGFMIPRVGWSSAVWFHVAASSIHASLLFTNFALSHTTLPYLPHYQREHWVERSLRRTIDIHSHSESVGPVLGPLIDKGVDWLMGYLNYQVEHHLWPLMPHRYQADPRVHAAIRQLILENPELQLRYNVTNYWTAMYDMYANLANIAQDHGYKLNKDAQHPVAPAWVKG
jgi:fatty acid desaturase